MCEAECPWLSRCNVKKYSDIKAALPPKKKLYFTGVPIVLDHRINQTFSCESEEIPDTGFFEYTLLIYLPCAPGVNAMDVWKFVSNTGLCCCLYYGSLVCFVYLNSMTNATCTLTLAPGSYPSDEYNEFRQNVTLISFCAGSITSISILVVLVSMLLALFM